MERPFIEEGKKKCLHMKRHQVDYQDSFLPGVNLYDLNSFQYFQVTVPAVRLSKEFIPSASKGSEKLRKLLELFLS